MEKLLQAGYKTLHTDSKNYLIAIPGGKLGEIALVAHMDTVRKPCNEPVELHFDRERISNVKGILGADDRAGVYGVLHLALKSQIKPIVILTGFEEIGGIGIKVMLKEGIFDQYSSFVKLFIELDRQGFNDWVCYYPYQPELVKNFAEYYGFIQESGSYSDVADLSKAYFIPHLNLSIGYFHQHTDNEYLDIYAMGITLRAVMDMLLDECPKVILNKENFVRGLREPSIKVLLNAGKNTITDSMHSKNKLINS